MKAPGIDKVNMLRVEGEKEAVIQAARDYAHALKGMKSDLISFSSYQHYLSNLQIVAMRLLEAECVADGGISIERRKI